MLIIQFEIESEATKEWGNVRSKIQENLGEIEDAVKHLNDITSFSKVNQERQAKHLAIRHAPNLLPEEPCTFPLKMIPRNRNPEFYGRTEELTRINQYLDYRGNRSLRTYTIYGRYVRMNEAIFLT
jgi:hypothetical protein